MDKQVIGLLRETRRVIEREGWTQGSYYGRGGGYCLMGVAFDQVEEQAALQELAEALGFENDAQATAWNDAKDRTKEQVLARLDEAISKAAV